VHSRYGFQPPVMLLLYFRPGRAGVAGCSGCLTGTLIIDTPRPPDSTTWTLTVPSRFSLAHAVKSDRLASSSWVVIGLIP
jgi:hypothetical protein